MSQFLKIDSKYNSESDSGKYFAKILNSDLEAEESKNKIASELNEYNIINDIREKSVNELEQKIEKCSIAKLIRALGEINSSQELDELTNKYEKALNNIDKQSVKLKSKAHIKEHIAMINALKILKLIDRSKGFDSKNLVAKFKQELSEKLPDYKLQKFDDIKQNKQKNSFFNFDKISKLFKPKKFSKSTLNLFKSNPNLNKLAVNSIHARMSRLDNYNSENISNSNSLSSSEIRSFIQMDYLSKQNISIDEVTSVSNDESFKENNLVNETIEKKVACENKYIIEETLKGKDDIETSSAVKEIEILSEKNDIATNENKSTTEPIIGKEFRGLKEFKKDAIKNIVLDSQNSRIFADSVCPCAAKQAVSQSLGR